jgi:hypothetical protein
LKYELFSCCEKLYLTNKIDFNRVTITQKDLTTDTILWASSWKSISYL